jgi:hypothetical protein
MATGDITFIGSDATNKGRVEYWSIETTTADDATLPFFTVDNRWSTTYPTSVTVPVTAASGGTSIIRSSLTQITSVIGARGLDALQAARSVTDGGFRLYVTLVGS